MQTKPIELGHLTLPSNVLLAPLAGYTNYPFRKLCLGYGAGLAFTEMVSAKGLYYGSENTKELLITGSDERIKAVQLFGSEPDLLRAVCESEALAPFPIVDLNMGCPMPKIYKNGEGSALLADPDLAARLISACKKSGKLVTVKFRIGIHEGEYVTEEFAKRCEGAGADLITVHGRVRDKIYAGDVNFAEIAKAKRAVSIPVIANGGVVDEPSGERLLTETGADGIMVARAALFDPQIFCAFSSVPRESKKTMILRQLAETERLYPEWFTTVYMRKMATFYLRGMRGSAKWKERFFQAKSPEAIRVLVEDCFTEEKM